MICLIYWFYVDIQRGLYSQAIFAIFSFALSVYGYIRWGKQPIIKE